MQAILTASFQDYDKHDFAKPAVMYILQQIRPKIRQKTDSHHYLKNSVIDLTPDERPDLEKITLSEIEFVADRVSFNANWFTTQKYMELWKEYFLKFLTEHAEIQKPFETIRTNFPDNWIDQFMLVRDLLDMVSSVVKDSYDNWHKKSMAEFCDSNLPLELYNLYNLSYIEKISVVRTFAYDLAKLQHRLYRARSNHKKITNESLLFAEQHGNISKLFAEMSRSELVLRFYLKSNNAKEMKDMFRPIPITLDDGAEEGFRIYFNDFKKNLFELTNILNKERYLSEDITLSSPKSESFRSFGEKLNQIILKHG